MKKLVLLFAALMTFDLPAQACPADVELDDLLSIRGEWPLILLMAMA